MIYTPLEIKHVPISELRHPEYNPRQIAEKDFQQLKTSIKNHGFVDPVIVNRNPDRDGVIVGGNQRVRAAQSLNMDTVPVVEGEWDLEKEKELNVRLNRNTGEWDWDKLANWFEIDELLNWGFENAELGFDDDMDFDDMGDFDDPEYPIVPEFSEKHDYVIVTVDNDIDLANMVTRLGLEKQESYKSSATGTGHVIEWSELVKLIDNE